MIKNDCLFGLGLLEGGKKGIGFKMASAERRVRERKTYVWILQVTR